MNWPKELIIKRDVTNTKVANKESVIEFINMCYDLDILEKYLLSLKSQNKLEPNELIDIIDSTQDRINEIKKFQKRYEEVKNDEEALSKFYEENYKFVEGLVDYYIPDTKEGE